jgi:hypothetical protein
LRKPRWDAENRILIDEHQSGQRPAFLAQKIAWIFNMIKASSSSYAKNSNARGEPGIAF